MTQKDYPEFLKVMTALAVLLNEELTAARAELYYESLKQYPTEAIKSAADKLSKAMRFFPKPVDFIEIIEGGVEDRAGAAWYFLLEAYDHPSPYKTLESDDPFLLATVEDMDLWGVGIENNGYPDNRKDCDFIRQEFIRRYKYHAKHSNPKLLPQALPGIFEVVNQQKELYANQAKALPASEEIADPPAELKAILKKLTDKRTMQ